MSKRNFVYNAIVVLFPCILYFIIGPVEIFASNQSEFSFGVKHFLPVFLGITIMLVAAVSLCLTIIPEKISDVISILIFTVSLLSYIQNMFFNKNIFNIDGAAVDWQSLKSDMIINLIIWLVLGVGICTIILIFKAKHREIIQGICIFIISIQLVTVVVLLLSADFDGGIEDKYVIDASEQYLVGKENNIIVLILDKYGNRMFDDMYNQDEHFADVLKDFTYYNNMNSKYAYTSQALTYTFTMYDAENESVADDSYLDAAWGDDRCNEIYSSINDHGYRCYFYSQDLEHTCKNELLLSDKFDDVRKTPVKIDEKLLITLMTKMSLYKYVPMIVKPRFEVLSYSFTGVMGYLDGEPPKYFNADYYNGICEQGLSIEDNVSNKFIIEHIEGMHDFKIDENVNPIDDIEYDLGCEKTQKGLFVILDKYFDELKRLGLYDSSTIIVMSDHGLAYDKCDAQPIFFIKLSGQNQEKMSVNAAPVSSEDVMPTILDLMSIDATKYGTTIWDWQEGDSRIRECAYPENDYEPFVYDGDREVLNNMFKSTPMKHK